MANPYTCKERLREVMTTGEFSDCVFVIEDQEFKVHRLILSMVSPVFKVMLNGCWASSENITISDIDSDTFKCMLKYMYVDQIEIETYDQACNLLYASKKYFLSHLVAQCIKYLKKETCMDNVLKVYEFCEFIQEDDLTAHVLHYIYKNANNILTNKLEDIDTELLKKVVKAEKLNIDESSLIKFVFEWSKHKCIKMRMDTTAENRRMILEKEGLLSSLRFLTLGRNDIAEMALESSILTVQQIDFIQLNVKKIEVQSDKVPDITEESFGLCLIRKPRECILSKPLLCIRRLDYFNSKQLSCQSMIISDRINKYSVRIKSDKTITVHSVIIPTQPKPEYFESSVDTSSLDHTYCENIVVGVARHGSETFTNTTFLKKVSYDATVVCIDLQRPFTFEKDHSYSVVFRWPSVSADINYQAPWRNNAAFCGPTIQFDELSDNVENENTSFLIGIKYTV